MTQNKVFVAVTGGIGSGKSTVMDEISKQGHATFSADEEGHHIYECSDIVEKVADVFPACMKCGILDRQALADEVFSDDKKLALLNEITHPVIMRRLFTKMAAAEGILIFAEVPLLFEGGYEDNFDEVIVILRPIDKRIKSVLERDGMSKEKVLERIKKQWDYEKNPPFGHTVIYNTGDLNFLREQVSVVIKKLSKKYIP